ncbi:MAG: MFS transporter [Planctomycetota bacterium]
MRDRRILYAAAFLRSLATSLVGVLIGFYLAKLGFDPAGIGVVVGAGLGGAAVAAFVVTLAGDRIGRRNALVALSLLGSAGGLVTATVSGGNVIAAAAFVGAGMKIGYDLLLYAALRAHRPPEERCER